MTSVGYPSNFDEGQYLYQVEGKKGFRSKPGRISMAENPFDDGASGGAWIVSSGNELRAIGLNSYKFELTPNVVWSPLFDANTVELYNRCLALKCNKS